MLPKGRGALKEKKEKIRNVEEIGSGIDNRITWGKIGQKKLLIAVRKRGGLSGAFVL